MDTQTTQQPAASANNLHLRANSSGLRPELAAFFTLASRQNKVRPIPQKSGILAELRMFQGCD